MKLMACSSALIIALLSISPVMADDSGYLKEHLKRLHENMKTTTSIAIVPTSRVMAEDYDYLEGRSKWLHEKTKRTTTLPATLIPRDS